jgi:GntR family transcriptional regulator, sialic acid-inducible nan operon repressor
MEIKDERIRRRKLYEEVEERLISDILARRYKEGEPLPSERELMSRFGVGRPAIREALFSMSRKGIVLISSGDRPRVTRPTPKVIIEHLSGVVLHLMADPQGERHFQEARAFFEAALARTAAKHATAEDLKRFKSALAANRESIGNLAEFGSTDVYFHYILATMPQNPIYVAIHEAIIKWLKEQRTVSLAQSDADRKAYSFHEKIYRAIKAKDADMAEETMLAHLKDVSDSYWRTKQNSPEQG